jgi:hypothetical protein
VRKRTIPERREHCQKSQKECSDHELASQDAPNGKRDGRHRHNDANRRPMVSGGAKQHGCCKCCNRDERNDPRQSRCVRSGLAEMQSAFFSENCQMQTSASRSLNREGARCFDDVSSRLSSLSIRCLSIILRKICEEAESAFIAFAVLCSVGEVRAVGDRSSANPLANCALSAYDLYVR